MTDAKIEMLVKTRDGLRMAADSINEYLETLGPRDRASHTEDVFPDLSMVIWKPMTGPKGPFEIADRDSNKNNAAFTRLGEYLNAHGGRATVERFFVWKFSDSSGSIGRKLVQKQS